MPLYLQEGLRLTPLATGLTFVWSSVGEVPAALLARRLSHIFGTRVLIWGTLAILIGFLVLWLTPPGGPSLLAALRYAPGLVLNGAGIGLFLPILITQTLSGTKPREMGSASGILSTAQQAAGSIGIAVLGAAFFIFLTHYSVLAAAHDAARVDSGSPLAAPGPGTHAAERSFQTCLSRVIQSPVDDRDEECAHDLYDQQVRTSLRPALPVDLDRERANVFTIAFRDSLLCDLAITGPVVVLVLLLARRARTTECVPTSASAQTELIE